MDINGPQPHRLNSPTLQTYPISKDAPPARTIPKLPGDRDRFFIDQTTGEVIGYPEYWRFISVTAIIYPDLILSNEVDEAPA